jgi:hypothetical protein
MTVVRLATGVPAMVAIMRGCLVGRLRLNRARTILRSRLHGGSSLHGDKERRRGRQQEESNESLHGNSPMRNPCEDIESQVEDKVSVNCFRDCI